MRKEFGTLRESTVTDVFKAALSKPNCTRAEIAKALGISVMTVGKVVDALVALGILRQSVAASHIPGRRSRILMPSRHKWIAVYEFSGGRCNFFMLDLSLRIIDSFDTAVQNNVFWDDALRSFAKSAAAFAAGKGERSQCIGCGILFSNDIGADTEKNITDILTCNGIQSCPAPVTGNSRLYSAVQLRGTLCEGESALMLFIDRNDIKSTLVFPKSASTPKLSDAGSFRLPNCSPLSELSCDAARFDELCDGICELIISAVCCTGVDTVALCGKLFFDIDIFRDVIGDFVRKACLERGIKAPEILSGDMAAEAAVGISGEIRDKWFFDVLHNSY